MKDGEELKILIVMPSGEYRGGAEEALVQLIRCREENRLNLTVVFLEPGNLFDLLVKEPIKISLIPAGRLRQIGRYFSAIKELKRLILKVQPDIVLSWMTKGHLYSGIAARWCGVPAAYFQMGLPEGGKVDRFSRLIPAVGALACSEFAAAEQRKCVRYPVVAVHLAADRERFIEVLQTSPSEMKARLGFDPDRPLVGIAGRLQKWKGMHIFAEAMVEVVKQRPDCQIVIVGGIHQMELEYYEFLKNRIAELGLKDRIQMAGMQTQIPRWMQAMDVFVHASEREPFGIVVVEALTLGKCVIATIPGGPEEIIQDGENGLLVTHGDVPALSASVLRFINDRDFAKKCSAGAWERSKLFSIPRFGRNFRLAIEKLLGTDSSTRQPKLPREMGEKN